MFVICMEGFEIPDGFENYPSELQKVAQEYQWIGRGKRWKEEEMEELKRTLLDEITENRKNKLNKI